MYLLPYSPKPTTVLAAVVVVFLSVFIYSQHRRIQELKEDLADRDRIILEQELAATKQANELQAVSKTLADISAEKTKVMVEVVEKEVVKYKTATKVSSCPALSQQATTAINNIIVETSR
jgi:hypothetical protein